MRSEQLNLNLAADVSQIPEHDSYTEYPEQDRLALIAEIKRCQSNRIPLTLALEKFEMLREDFFAETDHDQPYK